MLRCAALHRIASHCNALRSNALRSNALRSTALRSALCARRVERDFGRATVRGGKADGEPHLRRDRATSAPGRSHICARTEPHLRQDRGWGRQYMFISTNDTRHTNLPRPQPLSHASASVHRTVARPARVSAEERQQNDNCFAARRGAARGQPWQQEDGHCAVCLVPATAADSSRGKASADPSLALPCRSSAFVARGRSRQPMRRRSAASVCECMRAAACDATVLPPMLDMLRWVRRLGARRCAHIASKSKSPPSSCSSEIIVRAIVMYLRDPNPSRRALPAAGTE